MSNYTIYCTPDQTRKALELGAPIQYASIKDIKSERYVYVGEEWYAIPTAEQLIGWLEEQEGIISIELRNYSGWCYQVAIYDASYDISRMFKTRKAATIAAIDAALEYLNKKSK